MARCSGQRCGEALFGPQGKPETFYDYRRRPTTGLMALVVSAVAVFALLLSGGLNPPIKARGTTAPPSREAGLREQFLSDLTTHRPRNEHVVESGVSKPGIPASLATSSFTASLPYRLAYRCQGAGKVTATVITADGLRRRFPATDCGLPISSLAVDGYRSVTLAGDGHDVLILWAVTVTRPHPRLERSGHA